MEQPIYAGEFNRIVEFFKPVRAKNAASEMVDGNPVSLGQKKVKREDISGTEEDGGKILVLKVCKFIMRFDPDILVNGEKYYIQDIDGKFQVNNVSITGPGRNRFLELKCSSRE